MNTCILLSAGLGKRFGGPKALAEIKGKPVIETLQEQLADSKLDDIIVVLGAHEEKIKSHILKHTKVRFVYNKDYNLGQTRSFQAGLEELKDGTDAVLLLPVDYPFIKTGTINRLIDRFHESKKTILIPTHDGQKGHPPVFHIKLKQEFLDLDTALGLNEVSHRHEKDTELLSVDDPGVVMTFNTPEEFAELTRDM